MKINNKLFQFASDMQKELDDNKHKGDWIVWKDVTEIKVELDYHLGKLEKVMDQNDPELIREHIADCGNFLMMLGNAYGLYDKLK